MWKILFSKTSQHCFPCHTLFLLLYFNFPLIENWGYIYPLECKQAVTMGKGCSVTFKARFKKAIQSLVIWEYWEPSHHTVRTHKPHRGVLFRIMADSSSWGCGWQPALTPGHVSGEIFKVWILIHIMNSNMNLTKMKDCHLWELLNYFLVLFI